MPLLVVLFIFLIIYYGIPLLILVGGLTTILSYIIKKTSKQNAIILSTLFLIPAVIFYILSRKNTSIIEMFISGVFGGLFIYYMIISLAIKEEQENIEIVDLNKN